MIVRDIEIIERVSPDYVRAGFSGAFQQPEVDWEADIMSFKYYQLQHPDFLAEYGDQTTLMEVDSLESSHRHIVIALPVEPITHTEVIKSVLMVRNYRAMKVGMRQWSG